MGVILPGVDGTGFPRFFVGLGREEINFCGSGTGEVLTLITLCIYLGNGIT